MHPLNDARYRAWRAMLSALAGGGLTAAGLAGPIAGAQAATAPGAPGSTEGTTTTSASTTPAASTPEPASGQSSTSTSTTIAPPPAPSKTTSQPAKPKTPSKPTKPAPATTPAAAQPPTVVLQRRQKTTESKEANPTQTKTGKPSGANTPAAANPNAPNNVAISPQLIAGQSAALAAALASSQASMQALGFYRIPLFLLPIYKAAAVQYGVPWQILAAINEIETNYGTDQSVSTAGAVGWMQFMPETWLQYGVDALDAGYADPYNPVDAIFAAARYLRAAGAASDLHGAILAYNHSEEYVASVLLRAKLISSYPKSVIATLTGLTDGRLPLTGSRVAWAATLSSVPTASATARAAQVATPAAGNASTGAATGGSTAASAAQSAKSSAAGTSAATPAAAAAGAKPAPAPQLLQLADLTSAPNASVVAVQDGRVVGLGRSRRLGNYLVLRDVYGDLFTYAGLGSIAPTYAVSKSPRAGKSPVVEAASTHDPAPSKPASAGRQPVTLNVKKPARKAPRGAASRGGQASGVEASSEAAPAGVGKVRLFAHPGNPDAVAAAASAARRAHQSKPADRLPLRRGSVVATGTVLGRVRVPTGAQLGHLRFAIRPAGDSSTIDPRPILASWAQLETALHPHGAKAKNALLGATASDVLLMSKSQLERTVLSDPGVAIDSCSRHEIASGKVDKRVLAVLAFLSRSGLQPTARALRCGHGASAAAGSSAAHRAANAIDITAINGTAIAHHQGAGTITDLTIRTLLTLPEGFVAHAITSLMRYPGAPSTHAAATYWNRIRVAFQPATAHATETPAAAAAAAARSARAGHAAPSPLLAPTYVSARQWEQLVARIGALPVPTVTRKPSSAAIPDPKRH